MTAAVSSLTAARSLSTLLNGTKSNPPSSGSKALRCLWVAESAPIVRPWNPRIAQTNRRRPVACIASLMAASLASVPELQRNARETPGGVMDASFSRSRARTSL